MNSDLDSDLPVRYKRKGKDNIYHCLFVSCLIGGIIALLTAILVQREEFWALDYHLE